MRKELDAVLATNLTPTEWRRAAASLSSNQNSASPAPSWNVFSGRCSTAKPFAANHASKWGDSFARTSCRKWLLRKVLWNTSPALAVNTRSGRFGCGAIVSERHKGVVQLLPLAERERGDGPERPVHPRVDLVLDAVVVRRAHEDSRRHIDLP